MLFNFSKCKKMTISKSNRQCKMFPFEFSMCSADGNQRNPIEESDLEKDLGVYINSNLKFDSHVKMAAKKANSVLGMLKRAFRCWNEKTFKILYTTFVRPHLGTRRLLGKKGHIVLEKIQQRATKIVPSLKNLCYAERLAKLNLTSLEIRRNRGDLIQLFKIEKNFNSVKWTDDLKLACSIGIEGYPGRETQINQSVYL